MRNFLGSCRLILVLFGLLVSCIAPITPTAAPPSPVVAQPSPNEQQQALLHALQDLHFDKYLVTPEWKPNHTRVGEWDVYRYRTEDLQCILGGEYFIMVRKGTEADRTVLWLEGGGSCWPGRDDCTKEAQFPRWIEEQGLSSPDEANPVRTWNFIYVPYCDGSLHLGDSDADYDGDGVVDHHHWGLRSTSAAVRLMKELFPDSQRILIGGCSAGGGGTIVATPVVRLQFPDTRLYVLNVSGSALVNPALRERFKIAEETWNVAQFIPDDCPRCGEQITYVYSWLLARDSRLKVGLFSSYHDATFCSGWGMAPEACESLLVGTTETIRDDHPDTFKRYFIAGDQHCIGDYSYSVDGVSLWDWVGYLVNEDPRWVDILE